MERETYDFKTTNGVVVKIKKDITGREKRAVDGVIFESNSVKINSDGKMDGDGFSISGTALKRHREEIVKQLVFSISDKKENILDLVLDMPAKESEEVFAEVQKKYKELTEFSKKKS